MFIFFFFKQKTAYEMRISDWSSDVCSSDLAMLNHARTFAASSMKVRAWFNIASSVPLGASALSGVGNLGRGRNGFKAWRRHGPHHICPAMSNESSHKESSYTGAARPSAPQTPRPAPPGPVRSPAHSRDTDDPQIPPHAPPPPHAPT